MAGLIERARREVVGHDESYAALAVAIAALIVAFPLSLLGGAAADVAASAIAVTFLAYCYLTRDFTWTKEPWLLVALAIWAYLVVRGFLSIQPEKSGVSALIWVRFIIMAAALHVFLRRSKALQELLLWSTLIMALFGAADALLQYVRGYDLFSLPIQNYRLTGPLNNPAIGFVILFGGMPAIAHLFMKATSAASGRTLQFAAFSGLSAIYLTIALSGERMTFIQSGLALVVLFVLRPSWRVLASLAVVGVMVLTAIFVLSPHAGARQVSVLDELSKASTSSYAHAMIAGINVAQDNPVFGVGVKNFQKACPTFVEPQHVDGCLLIHPHHLWIQFASETGLIGAIGFAILFAIALHPALKILWRDKDDALLVGSTLAMVILIFPVMTSGNFFSSWRSALIWFALGTAAAMGRDKQHIQTS